MGLLAPALARPSDDIVAIDPVVEVLIGNAEHGSGVYVGGGLIVTAAHVADEGALTVVAADGTEATADVVLLDTRDDLAVIHVDDPGRLRPVNVVCAEPDVGAVTHAAGYPLGLGRVTVFGHIASDVHADGHWRSVVVVDSTVERGMSGGPLFDERNNLVGINVGMPVSPPIGGFSMMSEPRSIPLTGFTYAVSAPAVCRVLDLARGATS